MNNHLENIVGAIVEGEVVPFLGAGVNLFGREDKDGYKPGINLPSGTELSEYLIKRYNLPLDPKTDLSRVTQYICLMRGAISLYNVLSEVFDDDYPITDLHRFLASVPGILRDRGLRRPYQLIVTTNYDDVLERAFQAIGEEYDVVTYIATKTELGKFRHIPHGTSFNDSILISEPNTYRELPFYRLSPTRTVILKIHGMVERAGDRIDAQPVDSHDSFVITEDDYIDYLANTDISHLVPVQLKQKLTNSGFFFLGYGLKDWNLRVMLRRIWRDQHLSSTSWAVQQKADALDQRFWETHRVNIIESSLETYIPQLEKALRG